MWGQVVVALRDDDTIRRRRADADERTSIFMSIAVGEPTAQHDRQSLGRRRQEDSLSDSEVQWVRARSPPLSLAEPLLEKITIAVLRVRGGWRVMKGDREIGQFDYRVDAEEAGLQLTRRLHRAGQDVELLVQEDGAHDLKAIGHWRTLH